MPQSPITTTARPSGWTILIVPPRPDKRPHAFRLRKRWAKVLGAFVGTLALATGALVAVGTLVHRDTEEQLADAQRMVEMLTDSLRQVREGAVVAAAEPAAAAVTGTTPSTPVKPVSRRRSSSGIGLAAPAPGVVLPVMGRITSRFAPARFHPLLHIFRPHKGVDIYAAYGTSITAPAAGRVVFAGRKLGFGLVVELDHGDGVVSHYAHCSSLGVKAGEYVTAGAVIAKVGSTGIATGPHVHFEVHVKGKPVDPLNYILGPRDTAPSGSYVQRAGGDAVLSEELRVEAMRKSNAPIPAVPIQPMLPQVVPGTSNPVASPRH